MLQAPRSMLAVQLTSKNLRYRDSIAATVEKAGRSAAWGSLGKVETHDILKCCASRKPRSCTQLRPFGCGRKCRAGSLAVRPRGTLTWQVSPKKHAGVVAATPGRRPPEPSTAPPSAQPQANDLPASRKKRIAVCSVDLALTSSVR